MVGPGSDRPHPPTAGLCDRLEGNPVWRQLTRMPEKQRLYSAEVSFRQSWADAVSAFGLDVYGQLHQAALLLIKPDGLATGKARLILDSLAANGYAVVAVEAATLTRHIWQDIWRYQNMTATLDRLAVIDLVLAGSSVALLLRCPTEPGVPASVRLTQLKGGVDVTQQSPTCLRRTLAQPNRMLSFLHVANEPADIVRELGILFDVAVRRSLWHAWSTCPPGATGFDLARRLYEADAPSVASTDVDAALGSLVAALTLVKRTRDAEDPHVRLVEAGIAEMHAGRKIPWRRFHEALNHLGVSVDRWELALVATTYIEYDVVGRSKIIENVPVERWCQH